jgi:hypothetical protein
MNDAEVEKRCKKTELLAAETPVLSFEERVLAIFSEVWRLVACGDMN